MTQPEHSTGTDYGRISRRSALIALTNVLNNRGMPVGSLVDSARLVLTEALGKPVTITVGAEKESNN